MLNRVSLNTIGLNRIGLNRIGSPSRGSSSGSDRPYIDPEVLASLKAVCICYGKSNDDPDRAVVKNLVDPDNPFVISNAAFKLNSGFGGFVEDFTSWDRIDSSTAEISNDGSKIKCINTTLNVQYLFNYINRDISSFKVKISNFTKGDITYYYRKEDGIEAFLKITPLSVVNSDKVIELPKSYNTVENGTGSRGGFYSSNINIGVTIEQIPSFEGAFVTDGIDDLITSTKTVQEMLGGSNEITVVSMAHFIKGESNAPEICRINQIRRDTRSIRNSISKIGKSGIFGYTYKNGVTTINNILGDKNDCTAEGNLDGIVAPFSVEGYYYNNNSNPLELCSIAWYWTVIANKVLTTDQINQVIAYFNLDRTLKPDILCDVKKQGITNENHAEFGDKLIDFSDNGRDIQLNNIAWKLDSGIGKYETDLSDTRIWTRSKGITSSPFSFSYNGLSGWILFANTELTNSTDIPSFKIQIKGLLEGQELIYRYYDSTGNSNGYSITKDGEYTIPSDIRTAKPETSRTTGFQVVKNEANIITITQIPSHAGALCLDGVNDFGKATGMPIYKDYTVIADYIRISAKENAADASILSKSKVINNGAFLFNYLNVSSTLNSYSFGTNNMLGSISDSERKIYYQSKYVNEGKSINSGTGTDYDSMWLGIYRDDAQIFFNGAIYSLMTFPYSMSEFLIERQLKKHKLGTLYPNMVEFRPIVKSNLPYSSISYSVNPGEYISVDSMVTITVTLPNTSDKLMEVSCNAISDISISGDNGVYEITGKVVKSPQKINIVISSYLTMLNNSTLISNETLIKNE